MQARLLIASVLALVGSACSQSPPTINGAVTLEMNPSGNAPLAGLLSFTASEPVRATLTIDNGDEQTNVTPDMAFAMAHELMVLGLKAGRPNTVTLSIESEDGRAAAPIPIVIETSPLPHDFPAIEVVSSEPDSVEPGYTFMTLYSPDQAARPVLVAIDALGDVVWYSYQVFGTQLRLQNGNLLEFYDQERQQMVELDMIGNVVHRWHAAAIHSSSPPDSTPIDIDTIHHDVLELPSGNFLAISSEARHFDSYPTSETDFAAPWAPRDLIGDVLVELRRDGTIVREWHLFDLLDPYRFGYNSLTNGFYDRVYDEVFDDVPSDWAHLNGLAYDAANDTAILSLRWIGTVLKLELGTNRIDWILADPTGWKAPWSDLLLAADGPVEWTYGQHAPELTPQGTLLLYDNGSFGRAVPPNPQAPADRLYSRAVEYAIDEENRTVRQVWSYGGLDGDRFFSSNSGDIDWLPQTGNVLVTATTLVRNTDGSVGTVPAQGHVWARVIEVTHTDPARIVWEARIDGARQPWNLYRAERMPGLYP